MDDIKTQSKKVPGVGRYDPFGFDEKRIRPPIGQAPTKSDKITHTDEVINMGKM